MKPVGPKTVTTFPVKELRPPRPLLTCSSESESWRVCWCCHAAAANGAAAFLWAAKREGVKAAPEVSWRPLRMSNVDAIVQFAVESDNATGRPLSFWYRATIKTHYFYE